MGSVYFARNGTVPNFERVREGLLPELDEAHRSEIHGTTGGVHVFRYLLALWQRHPERPPIDTFPSSRIQHRATVLRRRVRGARPLADTRDAAPGLCVHAKKSTTNMIYIKDPGRDVSQL